MWIRTPKDIGAAIRDRRRKRGLDQTTLAALVGVSRKWIIDVEKGKAHADMSLVLKTFNALGVTLFLDPDDRSGRRADDVAHVDIDAIIADAKSGKR